MDFMEAARAYANVKQLLVDAGEPIEIYAPWPVFGYLNEILNTIYPKRQFMVRQGNMDQAFLFRNTLIRQGV